MIVNKKELLDQLHKEADSVTAAANAPYRNMILGAAELIEMQANMIAALRQQSGE